MTDTFLKLSRKAASNDVKAVGSDTLPESSVVPRHQLSADVAVRCSNKRSGHEAHDALEEHGSAAYRLVRSLVDGGVDTFFGIPGGPVSPVLDAVLNTPGARLIESRHETAAAFAAADFYRASGRVAAVVVTAGPGATNVVTGITSAHLEQVPVLLICGDVSWEANGARLVQDCGPEGISIEHMLSKVTRATVRVTHPNAAVAHGIAALEAARSPLRPGPALLVFPIHRGRVAARATTIDVSSTSVATQVSPATVQRVAKLLNESSHPLLILGAACRRYSATIARLVEALDVPFVTTPQAKGVVSELHPRSLRNGGLAASTWARSYTAQGVDVALVLGSDLDDCSIGQTRYTGDSGTLIHVDLNANVFGRNLRTEFGIVADIGTFAEDLRSLVISQGMQYRGADRLMRAVRSNSAFELPAFAADTNPGLSPARAIADLQAASPDNTAFISDIGEHMLFALHYLTARAPDAFTIHLGLGSMGSGICGAIGLGLAQPERPVVCICGDGGMQMVGMELLVAVKYRLPIVFAVFNDGRYNMVYHGYRQVFGREAEWDAPWVDFAEWARSMGMTGVRISRPGEITRTSLRQLTSLGKPVVLDIRIDPDCRFSGAGRNESLQHMSMCEAQR